MQGAEKEVNFLTEGSLDINEEALALRGFQSSGTDGAAKRFLQGPVKSADLEAAGARPVGVKEGFLEKVAS